MPQHIKYCIKYINVPSKTIIRHLYSWPIYVFLCRRVDLKTEACQMTRVTYHMTMKAWNRTTSTHVFKTKLLKSQLVHLTPKRTLLLTKKLNCCTYPRTSQKISSLAPILQFYWIITIEVWNYNSPKLHFTHFLFI